VIKDRDLSELLAALERVAEHLVRIAEAVEASSAKLDKTNDLLADFERAVGG
jgi:hypothetical protein